MGVIAMAQTKLPDGPQAPPLLQLIQWNTRPLEFLDTCANRYGDCFTDSFHPTSIYRLGVAIVAVLAQPLPCIK